MFLFPTRAQEEPVDMHAHLLPYPLLVDQDGTVSSLPGFPTFPDTKAPVVGKRQSTIPDALTT